MSQSVSETFKFVFGAVMIQIVHPWVWESVGSADTFMLILSPIHFDILI